MLVKNMVNPEFWRDDLDNRDVIVSVKCMTYNHEKYIRQALEGFVMQKTNFRFEVLVHDDASTDGTAEIIKEYAALYPSIIKPLYEEENQYSKRNGYLHRLMNGLMRGKYVAFCEGDDYWTDTLKLQKQVDWLDSHPDCTMVFTNALIHFEKNANARFAREFDENGQPKDCLVKDDLTDRDYTFLETYKEWFHATATWVFRKDIFETDIYRKFMAIPSVDRTDIKLRNACAYMGLIHSIKDTTAVYRIHGTGVSQDFDSSYGSSFIEYYMYIKEGNLGRRELFKLKKAYYSNVQKSIFLILSGRGKEGYGWNSLKVVIKYYPSFFFQCLITFPLYPVMMLYHKYKIKQMRLSKK